MKKNLVILFSIILVYSCYLAPESELEYALGKYNIKYEYLFPNNSLEGTSVTFTWNAEEIVSRYWIQIDDSTDFNNPIVDTEINDTKYTTSLISGTYYWRLNKWVQDTLVGWSVPQSFMVSDIMDRNLFFEISDSSPRYDWSLGGDSYPFIDTSEYVSETSSLRFGDIDDYQSSSISLQYSLNADSIIGFYAKVDSERSYDYISFYIDEVRILTAKSLGWEYYESHIESGNHTVTWTYAKDDTVSMGEDTGWIDNISFGLNVGTIEPENAETVLTTTPTISWSELPADSIYQFQLADNSSFEYPLLVDESNVSNNSITISSGLHLFSTYFWRIRKNQNGQWSAWSNIFQFQISLSGFTLDEIFALNDDTYYFVDNSDFCLVCINFSDNQMETIATYENRITHISHDDEYIYVSEGNELHKLSLSTGIEIDSMTFDGELINFILLNEVYAMTNDTSGSWQTNSLIRISDMSVIDSCDWRNRSASYAYSSAGSRVYYLRDGISPNDICYQVIDFSSDPSLGGEGDSIYHGEYYYRHPLKLFPDESKIVTGRGQIFNADTSIDYSGDLNMTYEDLVFTDNHILVLSSDDGVNAMQLVNIASPYTLVSTLHTYENNLCRILKSDTMITVITQEGTTGDIEFHRYSISDLIP